MLPGLAVNSISAFKNAGIPSLADLTDPLTALVVGSGGDRPQVSIRFNTDGSIDEASGDTGSALTYSPVGNWLNKIPGDASDWEIQVTIDFEDQGDPGTWTGATTGSFIDLATQRVFTWTKDANDLGTAGAELTIDVRQVSKPSNIATRAALDYDCQITS